MNNTFIERDRGLMSDAFYYRQLRELTEQDVEWSTSVHTPFSRLSVTVYYNLHLKEDTVKALAEDMGISEEEVVMKLTGFKRAFLSDAVTSATLGEKAYRLPKGAGPDDKQRKIDEKVELIESEADKHAARISTLADANAKLRRVVSDLSAPAVNQAERFAHYNATTWAQENDATPELDDRIATLERKMNALKSNLKIVKQQAHDERKAWARDHITKLDDKPAPEIVKIVTQILEKPSAPESWSIS